jgi:hypothetical protein
VKLRTSGLQFAGGNQGFGTSDLSYKILKSFLSRHPHATNMAATPGHESANPSCWDKLVGVITFGHLARQGDRRQAEELERKGNVEAFLEPGKETQPKWLKPEGIVEPEGPEIAQTPL